jgi:hypothetical protein
LEVTNRLRSAGMHQGGEATTSALAATIAVTVVPMREAIGGSKKWLLRRHYSTHALTEEVEHIARTAWGGGVLGSLYLKKAS